MSGHLQYWKMMGPTGKKESLRKKGNPFGKKESLRALVVYQPHISVIYEEVPDTGCMSLIWPDMSQPAKKIMYQPDTP